MPTTVKEDAFPMYDEADMQSSAPSEDKMTQLANLAQQQLDAEAAVLDAQAKLDQAEKKLKDIKENLLPGLMDELKLQKFSTSTGINIEVKETVRASPGGSKDLERFMRVCKWLKDHGHGRLIKRDISVQFGVGEENEAERLLEQLRPAVDELGKNLVDDSNINTATFSAFVRERLEAGEEVPDFFNVFRQRVSNIVRR